MAPYPWAPFVMNFRILLCLIGVALSVYSLYDVETETTPENTKTSLLYYISSRMSCSKVHSSKYAVGFGLVEPLLGKDSLFNAPNSISGIAFYIIVLILGFFGGKVVAWTLVVLSFLSCLGCVYLGYILYFVLHESCPVSVAIYVVSALLLVLNICHLAQLPTEKAHDQ